MGRVTAASGSTPAEPVRHFPVWGLRIFYWYSKTNTGTGQSRVTTRLGGTDDVRGRPRHTSHQTTHYSLLQNMCWVCRMWWAWTRNMSLIALPWFMYLSDELILTFHWYLYNLQPYKVVILVKFATKKLKFPPKHGLAVSNIARKWWGYTGKISMIPIPGFMNLPNQPILILD